MKLPIRISSLLIIASFFTGCIETTNNYNCEQVEKSNDSLIVVIKDKDATIQQLNTDIKTIKSGRKVSSSSSSSDNTVSSSSTAGTSSSTTTKKVSSTKPKGSPVPPQKYTIRKVSAQNDAMLDQKGIFGNPGVKVLKKNMEDAFRKMGYSYSATLYKLANSGYTVTEYSLVDLVLSPVTSVSPSKYSKYYSGQELKDITKLQKDWSATTSGK